MAIANGLNLVSISVLLPYSGVDHAGGELLLQHYRVLAAQCARVDAFAVGFDKNAFAASRERDIGYDSYHAFIVDLPRWRKSVLGKLIARLWSIAMPVLPDIGICASIRFSKPLRESILNADIVELQWFEFFFFARLISRINPAARIIGFVHDVPSQKFERKSAHWPAPVRRLYLAYVAWLEGQMLRKVHKVTVLSLKDAVLMNQRSSSIEVFVLDPPLDLGRPWSTEDNHGHIDSNAEANTAFGFIGAFYRPENNDAGLWLLSEIWPYVLKRCPAARLYLVGSSPSSELRAVASKFGESVTVTGYVDDIDSFYDRFSTVVIPMRYGAGVKFKTITGILAGKNVVATPIAIEGTLPTDYFFAVSDSAETLAEAMVALAVSPNVGREISKKARTKVGSRYSFDNYAQAVRDAYHLTKGVDGVA